MENPVNETASKVFRFLSNAEKRRGGLSAHYGPVVKGMRTVTFKCRDWTRHEGHLTIKIDPKGRFKVLSAEGVFTPHRRLDRLQELSTTELEEKMS